jgi:hypothetical protein
LIHFTCWFRALRSGILQKRPDSWWSQDYDTLSIFKTPLLSASNQHAKWINLFRLDTCTQMLTAPGRKKSVHLACRFRALGSRISQIPKKVPESCFLIISGFRHFFRISKFLFQVLWKGMQSVSTSPS